LVNLNRLHDKKRLETFRDKTAMAFFRKSPPQEKNKTHELNNVSVMASKGLGRVWSFNINFWVLMGIAAALIFYLIFSFMLLVWYFDEHHQKSLLGKLEQDFKQTQKALYQAKQRLKFLENYIDPSKIPTESPKKTPKPQSPPRQPETATVGSHKIETESAVQNTLVSIEELETDRRGTTLSVSFKLARSRHGTTPIRGYIFIVAVDRASDPPRLWSTPKAAFENGSPVDPKRGQAYKIRNFRRIRARWAFESAENVPTELRILVYDQSGGLLLRENYDLEKDSQP
jgi:hypothetical protein